MSISFNGISNSVKTPFAFIEFDNSLAGITAGQNYKALVIGQKLASGTHAAESKVRVTSPEQAADLFGAGSMLHSMIKAYKDNDSSTELWAIALDDNGSGTKSEKTLTVTASSAKAGILEGYIGGVKIQSGVTANDSATQIATDFADQINAEVLCPFTAVAVAGVITLTAKHAGEVFEELEVSFNHNFGEKYPDGVSVAVAGSVVGAGNPDLQDAINVFGDEQFNVIVNPYLDTANLSAIETEMGTRFGPAKQTEGMVVGCKNATHGALGTLGDSRNSQFVTILGVYKSPTPSYNLAAIYAANLAFHGQIDPARPFQTLELKGAVAPKEADKFTREERNLLILDGIATSLVDAGGKMRIEYAATTFNLGVFGNTDYSYQNVNTLLTLSYLRFSLRNRLLSKYPRHKLANNGTQYGSGQKVVTPSVIRGEIIAQFGEWEDLGLVENKKQFIADLIVERNATNKDRVDFLISPDLMNQMRIFAGQVQFIL